jgi:hypothetical protein
MLFVADAIRCENFVGADAFGPHPCRYTTHPVSIHVPHQNPSIYGNHLLACPYGKILVSMAIIS